MSEKENNPPVTSDDIKQSIPAIEDLLEKIRSGEIVFSQKRATFKEIVEPIREHIYQMRTRDKLSFKAIAWVIEEASGYKISDTTIRGYCFDVLGIEPERRKVSKAEARIEGKAYMERSEKENSTYGVSVPASATENLPEKPEEQPVEVQGQGSETPESDAVEAVAIKTEAQVQDSDYWSRRFSAITGDQVEKSEEPEPAEPAPADPVSMRKGEENKKEFVNAFNGEGF